MEIVIPNRDFDFHSARSSPHATAPSTPKRFGEYCFTAPPSPQHLSEFYRDFDDFYVDGSSHNSEIPIGWEEEPKFKRERTIFEDDFAFDVSGEFEKMTLPAEELFDGGKIRPLKPPSKLDHRNRADEIEVYNSPKKKKDLNNSATERERGRDRNPSSLSSSSSRRGSRSLSPYRVSKYPWEEVEEEQRRQRKPPTKQSSFLTKPTLNATSSSLSTTSTTKNGSRKWRLKDFFLFRSASEGRASNKDPLRKYTALFRKHDEVKSSSFRSNDGANNSKRRGAVSAHELHYTKNRAVSEDLKKKTFLPYKQGILGRLSFNPAVHALSNGFGLSRK